MNKVEPIRNQKKIEEIKAYLKNWNEKYYMMWLLGSNIGLRVSDIMKIKVGDIAGKDHLFFRDEKLFTRAANGEMTSDEFLTRLGFEDPRFHMINYINNFLTLDPGFREFAEKYYRQYDFVLLSNDVAEWSAWITEHHDLDQYFTHKIVSGDVKCRKPDRKIYEIALEKAGKKPEECCFVDNSVKNLITAAELGIEPILFNRDGEEYTGTIVNSFAELAEVLDEGEKE